MSAGASLPGGETVLMTAARTGNPGVVSALLARGANPNARERVGQTALMWAAAEGHTAVVQALVAAGADVRATLGSGFTPFFFAVREGHIDVVRALLESGVNVNETLKREDGPEQAVNNASYKPVAKGTSPLLIAVQNGHFELAVALVDAGADPNDARTGFTALHTMSWVRKPDASDTGDPSPIGSGRLTSLQFVRALVERGAKVNARLDKGAPRVPNIGSREAAARSWRGRRRGGQQRRHRDARRGVRELSDGGSAPGGARGRPQRLEAGKQARKNTALYRRGLPWRTSPALPADHRRGHQPHARRRPFDRRDETARTGYLRNARASAQTPETISKHEGRQHPGVAVGASDEGQGVDAWPPVLDGGPGGTAGRNRAGPRDRAPAA